MRMHRGRLVIPGVLLLTASCGTFLSLGVGGDDEDEPPASVPDGSAGVDGRSAEGSGLVDKPGVSATIDAKAADADTKPDPPPVFDGGALVFVTSVAYSGSSRALPGVARRKDDPLRHCRRT